MKGYNRWVGISETVAEQILEEDNREYRAILVGIDAKRRKICIFTMTNGYYEFPLRIFRPTELLDADCSNPRIEELGRAIYLGKYRIDVEKLLK